MECDTFNKIENKIDIKDMVNYYKSEPMSLKNICNKYNICQPTASKILKENNCRIYQKAEVYNPKMNQSYFNQINTEQKAYFLGLIIADGCVFESDNGRQDSISITLTKNDDYLLYKFKDDVGTNTNVIYDNRNCANIAIRSNIMSNDLKKYGVIPRKSNCTFLPILDREFMPHLIRGLFDGDGSITSKMNEKTKNIIIELIFVEVLT